MARVLSHTPRRLARCGLAALTFFAVAGCTLEVGLAERVSRLGEELGGAPVTTVNLQGQLVELSSETESVTQADPRAEVERKPIDPVGVLEARPLQEFDVEAMVALLEENDCADDLRPFAMAHSVVGGSLLVHEGCGRLGVAGVETTLLDGRELTQIDDWTAEAFDGTLTELESVIGPTVISLELVFVPGGGPGERSSYIRAIAPERGGCLPQARRFADKDAFSAFGYLTQGCPRHDGEELGREFALSDISGAQLVDARERLTVSMEAVAGFNPDDPGLLQVEWRGNELVLNTPGAVWDEEDRDLRVPLV